MNNTQKKVWVEAIRMYYIHASLKSIEGRPELGIVMRGEGSRYIKTASQVPLSMYRMHLPYFEWCIVCSLLRLSGYSTLDHSLLTNTASSSGSPLERWFNLCPFSRLYPQVIIFKGWFIARGESVQAANLITPMWTTISHGTYIHMLQLLGAKECTVSASCLQITAESISTANLCPRYWTIFQLHWMEPWVCWIMQERLFACT